MYSTPSSSSARAIISPPDNISTAFSPDIKTPGASPSPGHSITCVVAADRETSDRPPAGRTTPVDPMHCPAVRLWRFACHLLQQAFRRSPSGTLLEGISIRTARVSVTLRGSAVSGPQSGPSGPDCLRDSYAAIANNEIALVDQRPRVLDVSRCHVRDARILCSSGAKVNGKVMLYDF